MASLSRFLLGLATVFWIFEFTAAAAPRFTATGVVNAGSFQPGIVPGGIISIFGEELMSGVSGPEHVGGATTYKGTSVSIGGYPAPLLVLANVAGLEQINLQAPFELTSGTTVVVEVVNNGSSLAVPGVVVHESQPGIFQLYPGGGQPIGAVLHQACCGSRVRPGDPAQHGEIVSVFVTGMGPVAPIVPTGVIGPVPPAVTVLPVTVGIADLGMPVVFSGYAPGFIGLYQINFQIADSTPSGSHLKLNVKVGNAFSQDSTIAVSGN